MATLYITNNFTIDAQGTTHKGHQGETTDAFGSQHDVTVSGLVYQMTGQLATATVNTLWDEDSNFPADFDYGWFWADQIVYLQIIGSSGNVTHRLAAKQPFVLPGYDEILPAADTTLITGGTEPTMENIDSIVLGNYSGSTVNYCLFLVD